MRKNFGDIIEKLGYLSKGLQIVGLHDDAVTDGQVLREVHVLQDDFYLLMRTYLDFLLLFGLLYIVGRSGIPSLRTFLFRIWSKGGHHFWYWRWATELEVLVFLDLF